MSYEIIEKVTCKACGHFLGCITSDGRGPILDECPVAVSGDKSPKTPKVMKARGCPMIEALAAYQPIRRPTGIGNSRPGYDADAGSYRDIAVRAMEDG